MATWHPTHQTLVHTWHCDHYGHMNVRYYAHIFDDAGFVLWTRSGVTRQDMATVHTVVARTETDLVRELVAGQPIRVRSRWVALGTKSVTYAQELLDAESGEVHARQRVVEVFFDPQTRASRPIPEDIRRKLEQAGTG